MSVSDLYTALPKTELSHKVSHLQPTLEGQQVSPQTADLTVTTSITAVWAKSDESTAVQGVWFSLATYNVRLTLPRGYTASRLGSSGSNISLGKIHVQVEHDTKEAPLLDASGKEVLQATCVHSGPNATTESESVSNSVSQDVGVNIGAFADAPKAGVSYSESLSHTVSTDIRDVTVVTNIEDNSHTVWWEFDFTGLPSSPTATSTFDYTCQAIWRYQPLEKKDIDSVPFVVKVRWTPHAYWIVSDHRVSEGPGGELTPDPIQVKLQRGENGQNQLPPSHVGIVKTPTS